MDNIHVFDTSIKAYIHKINLDTKIITLEIIQALNKNKDLTNRYHIEIPLDMGDVFRYLKERFASHKRWVLPDNLDLIEHFDDQEEIYYNIEYPIDEKRTMRYLLHIPKDFNSQGIYYLIEAEKHPKNANSDYFTGSSIRIPNGKLTYDEVDEHSVISCKAKEQTYMPSYSTDEGLITALLNHEVTEYYQFTVKQFLICNEYGELLLSTPHIEDVVYNEDVEQNYHDIVVFVECHMGHLAKIPYNTLKSIDDPY